MLRHVATRERGAHFHLLPPNPRAERAITQQARKTRPKQAAQRYHNL